MAAADIIAGPAGGTPSAGGTPAAGAPGTPGAAAPAAGAFAWDASLDAPVVDLLKAKGMWDDPVKGTGMLAKSYFEANKALSGGDVIIAPGDWTKQDQVDKYLGKTRGVAKLEDYDPKFGDGVTVHAPLVEFSKKLAWEWGVPKALFQKGIDAWQAFAGEQNAMYATEQAKKNDEAVKGMETRLGKDVFNAGVANAQTVFKTLLAKGSLSRESLTAIEANIGAAPLLELMFAIGSGMKNEGAVLGNGGGTPPTDPKEMSPQQAAAEISRLRGDKDFLASYEDAKHAQHTVAVERMRLLYEAQARRPV